MVIILTQKFWLPIIKKIFLLTG